MSRSQQQSQVPIIALAILAAGITVAAVAALAFRPGRNDVAVGVLADGTVLLDGEAAELSSVTLRLAEAAEAGGTVRYYRQNPTDAPTAAADKAIDAVMDLITRYQLPMTFASKPAYIDALSRSGA